MRQTKNIKFDDDQITVKELTVEELADILDTVAKTADNLDLLFDGGLPSEAVVVSSGISRTQLHTMPPSQIYELWQAVEDVNPFFLKAVQLLLGTKQTPAPLAPEN